MDFIVSYKLILFILHNNSLIIKFWCLEPDVVSLRVVQITALVYKRIRIYSTNWIWGFRTWNFADSNVDWIFGCRRTSFYYCILYLSLVDDSILFKCRYARTVSATSEMTIAVSGESAIGSGELMYSMYIDAGNVGGNSVVTISPNHDIAGIGAR